MFNRFSARVVALFLSPLIACRPAEGKPDPPVENEPIAEGHVETMETPTWVTDLFRAVDTMDANKFVAFMAEDVFFRSGSAESLRGRAAVRDDISSLFSRIKGINHELSDTWVHGDVVVVHGIVTYTRPDDTTLTVPFADIWKMEGDLIQEYLIFIDNTKL
jgi:ketosteroid isomerase-like protein